MARAKPAPMSAVGNAGGKSAAKSAAVPAATLNSSTWNSAALERVEEPVTEALSLLRHDHRVIARLFGEFEDAVGHQVDPLARRICKMLALHAQIEEELFYPAVRLVIDPQLIDAALAEHADVKLQIRRIEAMTSAYPEFAAAMAALSREIAAHVAAEEADLFPRLPGTRLNLEALGIALAERKETLMEVMGLHEDDELRATVDNAGSDDASTVARH